MVNIMQDEKYIEAYIGKNYDKIMNSSFSWPTFLVSIIYFLYRKLWLYALIYYIINFLITLIFDSIFNMPTITSLISVIYSFIVAKKFKDLYLYKINRDIKRIRMSTNNEEEILEKIKKKGGVSNIALIIALVVYLVVFIITFKEEYERISNILNNTGDITEEKVTNIQYNVPEGFVNNYESNTYSSYKYIDEENDCNFIVQTMNNAYDNEEAYLKNVYQANNIESIVINNNTWYYFNEENTYIYALIYEDKLYTLNYYINIDSGVCSSSLNDLTNTLNLVTGE